MELRLEVLNSLKSIPASAWNQLSPPSFPFSDHEYLYTLETSGSVGGNSGWQPRYFVVWNGAQIVGALYAYLKDNSYGEYIFDWSWAQAFSSHGVPYYPKLVSAVPFTPATGAKLLVHPEADRAPVVAALIDGARAATTTWSASSLHFLFCAPQELGELEAKELLLRHTFQFHWRNRGYASFDAFLDALKSRKRKQIVKERTQLAELDLDIQLFTGDALLSEHAQIMHAFYFSTITKMGAIAYLTPAFFEQVFERMRSRVLLWLARPKGGDWIAGALHYQKGDSLFGRYWGCAEEVRNLHFELCYYRGIELAIANRWRLFEAGAQGEHKVARGFLPEVTYSAHWIAHPQFRAAIATFLTREKEGLRRGLEEFGPQAPYRNESE